MLNFFHQGQPQTITPGIYFGMPADLYHAIPALSASGIKNLLVSAPDFYFNSWLNPLREEDAEDDDGKEWKRFGTASHMRILEGKEMFYQHYCVEFVAPEGCLDTKEDLKKYCDDNGIETKVSWSKPKFIEAIRMAGHSPLIYAVEEEIYYRATGGKIQLKQRELRRIEIAAAMIENHPQLQHCFNGGYPEVSVIWERDGLFFKCRFDKLKMRAAIDLKTFTNRRNKPIDKALYEAMGGLKYHIQASIYSEGFDQAVKFAREGTYVTYSVNRYGPSPDFIKGLAEADGCEFYFVFQKKGGAPLARGKKFIKLSRIDDAAKASIDQAIALYHENLAKFGTGVWVDDTPITDFEDDLFPTYATEI